ncbi:MAG: TonB family protein [Thermoanaerobaculia bacterium]|nr:TonB family protein [Thermoanaerobaculia bacterium]
MAESPTSEASTDIAGGDSSDIYGTMRLPIVTRPKVEKAEGKPPAPHEAKPAEPAPVAEAFPVTESAPVAEPVVEASPEIGVSDSTVHVAKDSEDGTSAGERFGQYSLLDRIAVGGMAEVWKARMQGVEGFQKNVAIKRILPHLTDSSDFLTMFIDEAKLAAQLNHPNIVHIYDLGKIDDDYYIAMEYIAGKDLRTILNEGRKLAKPMPLGLAVLIASRLASGLDHAHRKRDFDNRDLGLVHRDVSPQNVLVSYSGDIKLCDFGIAKAVAKASKTQMGALKGKLQYMSPEQAWGRVVDARSDIFSLGAVLFEMLTGERLFAGESEISVLESVREGKVRGVRNIAGQVPVELDAVVAKALAKDPDERFQSAGEMQQELEAILYSLKPTPVEATLTEYMRSIFGEAADAESGESQEIAIDLAPTPSVLPEQAGEVAAVAPRGKPTDSDEGGSSMGLWLGIAVALLVLGGVGWYLLAGRTGGEGEAPPLQAPPIEVTPGPGAESPETVPADGDAGTDVGAADGAGEGAEGGTPGVTPGAGAEGVSVPPAGKPSEEDALAAMVDKQVKAREAELERQQDTARKELEKQLEETRLAAERAEQEAATQSAALAAAAEPPAKTEPELPSADSESTTAGEATKGSTADSASETSSPPAQAAAPPPVVKPEPKPAAVEPEPVKTAAPPKPRYQEGQLVPSSTAGLIAPRLVSVETPQYPPVARRMKVQGTVVVAALVDEKGEVIETRLVQGVKQNVGLNEAAEKAARSARFQPATIEGVRVQTWFNLSVPFKL